MNLPQLFAAALVRAALYAIALPPSGAYYGASYATTFTFAQLVRASRSRLHHFYRPSTLSMSFFSSASCA
jgi:hypothetical protein